MTNSKRLALLPLFMFLPSELGAASPDPSDQARDQITFTEPGRPADVKKTYEGRCGRRTYLLSVSWSGYRPDGAIAAIVAGGVKVSRINIDQISRKFLSGRAITEMEIAECRGDEAVVRISTVDAKSPSRYPNFVKFRIDRRGNIVDPQHD